MHSTKIKKTKLVQVSTADQNQANAQLVSLKAQLKDEKARYDQLDKNLKSFSNSEQGIRSQLGASRDPEARSSARD